MENENVEKFMMSKGKEEAFIKLIVKIFNDNNIDEEKRMEILKDIYK